MWILCKTFDVDFSIQAHVLEKAQSIKCALDKAICYAFIELSALRVIHRLRR